MRIPRPHPLVATAAATVLAAAMSLTPTASAQEIAADAPPIEVIRDATDLRDILVPRPDLDSVDTALVFTNPRNAPTLVVCAGRNAEGRWVGRAKTEVPAHGVRLILASDLSNGRDYVGSATCKSRRPVVPTAFVIGADLSDAPAKTHRGWQGTRITFPVIATF